MATLDVEKCMESLSRENKIALLSGSDMWHTQAVPNLNVPRLRVSDGRKSIAETHGCLYMPQCKLIFVLPLLLLLAANGIRGTRFFAGIASNCFPVSEESA